MHCSDSLLERGNLDSSPERFACDGMSVCPKPTKLVEHEELRTVLCTPRVFAYLSPSQPSVVIPSMVLSRNVLPLAYRDGRSAVAR